MKIKLSLLLLLAFVVSMMNAPSTEAASTKLIQKSDMTYQGSFKVPNDDPNGWYDYAGGALAYNPANNSLYFLGWNNAQSKTASAEFTIPALGGRATTLQRLTDPLEGKGGLIGASDIRIGGQLVYKNKLYVSAYIYYDANGGQTLSHFTRPLNLSTTGQVTNPVNVGSFNAGYYSGYMAQVPLEWRTGLGGPAVTGNCCIPIVNRTSYGPSLFAFDPENMGNARPLVYYDGAHQTLGEWSNYTTPNPVYNQATGVAGVVLPEGSRSVLFFGNTGTGVPCYGGGVNQNPPPAGECYDPVGSAKGTHAYPYEPYVWAYDINDMIAVRNGTKQAWDVVPYATWVPSGLTFFDSFGGAGAAYDPATQRVFFAQYRGDDLDPLIHVFKLNLTASTNPPPPPPATLVGDINKDGIVNSLDWSAMNGKWFTSDTNSDLNKDGIVNSLDFSLLNANWFKTA